MKKLSEQLLEMGQRTAAWENRTAADREADRKEFEAEKAEAQKSAQSARAAFAAKLDSMKASQSAHWQEVRKSFDNQMAAARSRAAELKSSHDLAAAKERADVDETYAQIAAEFAYLAAAEANAAMLEASQSRAHAKTVEKTA